MAARHLWAGLVLVLVALGCAGLGVPAADPEVVEVRVAWPGASAEAVESAVVIATEEALRGITGVANIRAVARDGSGVVRMELAPGGDADRAMRDVREALERVTLPDDAEAPHVWLVPSDDEPSALVLPERGDAAAVARDLERHPGVRARVVGTLRGQIRVVAAPERLQAYGLTMDDVASALGAANIAEAAGTSDAILRVAPTLSVDGLEHVVLRADGVRLVDVCTIELGDDPDGPVVVGPTGDRTEVVVVHGAVDPAAHPPGQWIDAWTDVSVRAPDRDATVRAAAEVARALGGVAVVYEGTVDAVVHVPGDVAGELPVLPGADVWTGEAGWVAELTSPSLEALRRAVDALGDPIPGTRWVTTDLPPPTPSLTMTPHGRGMATPAAMNQALAWSSGRVVAHVDDRGHTLPVRLSTAAPDDPTRAMVSAIDGSLVPLGSVADLRLDRREVAIPRVDGKRAVTVQAALDGPPDAVEAEVRRRLAPDVTLRVVRSQ